MLFSLNSDLLLDIISPTDFPIPYSFFAPVAIALLRYLPVSFTMPKVALCNSSLTSSDVWPMKESSKSWIIHAPFVAIAVIIFFFMRSMMIGDNPTFIGWAPIPRITGLLFWHALTIALTVDTKSFTARRGGSLLIKHCMVSPFDDGVARMESETLLFLLVIEEVLTFFNDTGLYFLI